MNSKVDIRAIISHIIHGDGADRCRICMNDTIEGQAHIEDLVLVDENKHITLAALLESITGIEMTSSTTLPANICTTCYGDVAKIIEFIEMCKYSTKQWNQVADYLSTVIPHKNTTNMYIQIGSRNKIFKESSNNKVSKFKMYTNHSQIQQANVPMTCEECDKQFHNLKDFNKHLINLGKKMCSVCHKIVNIAHHKAHMHSHDLVVYRCRVCYKTFEKEQALSVHKLKHKNRHEMCTVCRATLRSPLQLQQHKSLHKKRKCGCGKIFSNRICFVHHTRLCPKKGDTVFYCDYCGQHFKLKTSVRLHIVTHLYGRRFQCEVCGKKFISQAHLLEHGNTHERVGNRYVCDCGAKYSTQRSFKRHLKRHTDSDKGVVGNNVMFLQEHRNKQKNMLERYECECGATYCTRKGYEQHQQTHGNVGQECFTGSMFVCYFLGKILLYLDHGRSRLHE